MVSEVQSRFTFWCTNVRWITRSTLLPLQWRDSSTGSTQLRSIPSTSSLTRKNESYCEHFCRTSGIKKTKKLFFLLIKNRSFPAWLRFVLFSLCFLGTGNNVNLREIVIKLRSPLSRQYCGGYVHSSLHQSYVNLSSRDHPLPRKLRGLRCPGGAAERSLLGLVCCCHRPEIRDAYWWWRETFDCVQALNLTDLGAERRFRVLQRDIEKKKKS